ncbi:MAG: metallophosphoesterase [Tannerellaceae bacterium]|nr:metallophosphoesterase [Tannerellaceae bacterium]
MTVLLLACSLTLSAHDIAPKEENVLRIMSYNVHNFFGMDGVRDYQRIADVINDVAPDVVAIQEADSATLRSEGLFTLKELSFRTLMHPVYAPAIDYQGGKYGIGILSKEKPVKVQMIPLPGREESRMLLIAEFEKYAVACTHFSLTAEDRLASVAVINEAVKGITKPLFLAGDINATPDSPPLIALKETFEILSNPKVNTVPVVNPNRCIDYIYGYKNNHTYTVLRQKVIDEQVASDHLPLFVDVRLKAGVSGIFGTKPYLQNPTGNGITISWFTKVPTHSWIEYGTDETMPLRKELIVDGQVVCNVKHHKIRLTDLQPGVPYYYRVCSREITLYQAYKKEFGHTARSETYSFSLPASSTDFTALIFNDLHKNKQVLNMLSEQIKGVRYDLVFFNGDCIDDPANEAESVDFLSLMNEKVHAETVPVFYLRGNHEIRNAYSIHLRKLFDYVGDKTYAAFNWGDTRFVMLDCGEDKPDNTEVYYNLNDFNGLRNDQVAFLKKELTNREFKKATKKVLIHHIPIYGLGGSYNPCLELWGGLLSKAPFDICLNGHTHRYAYHPKGSEGNNYPVMIGGGNRPDAATVMILQKTGKTMTLKVLNTKGETLWNINL